jgi:hypothetical protein
MAGPTGESVAPPCLVDNVETLAHCALILANGAVWFRQLGTPDSPGTVVCTVTGHTQRAGVGEVAMGTPLAAVVDAIGGGAREGRRVKAVMQGVAAALVPGDRLDALVSWEGMEAVGSGLGAAAFIVFDDAAPSRQSQRARRDFWPSSHAVSARRASAMVSRSRTRSTGYGDRRRSRPTSTASSTSSRRSPTVRGAHSQRNTRS